MFYLIVYSLCVHVSLYNLNKTSNYDALVILFITYTYCILLTILMGLIFILYLIQIFMYKRFYCCKNCFICIYCKSTFFLFNIYCSVPTTKEKAYWFGYIQKKQTLLLTNRLYYLQHRCWSRACFDCFLYQLHYRFTLQVFVRRS